MALSLRTKYAYGKLLQNSERIREETKITISAHVRPRKFVEAISMTVTTCKP